MNAEERLEGLMRADRALAEQAADGAVSGVLEVQVGSDETHHLRYGGNEVVLDHTVRSHSVTIRAVVDGYLGVATTERCDREGLTWVRDQAVRAAEAQARRGGSLERPYELPGPEAEISESFGDPSLVDWGQGGGKIQTLHDVLARADADSVVMAGSVSTSMRSQTLLAANSPLLNQRYAVGNGQFIAQTRPALGSGAGSLPRVVKWASRLFLKTPRSRRKRQAKKWILMWAHTMWSSSHRPWRSYWTGWVMFRSPPKALKMA